MQDPDHTPPTPGCVAAILPAAGSGQRFGSHRNKLFADLDGRPLWAHAVSRLAASSWVGRIVMSVSESDESIFRGEYGSLVEELGVELVRGGEARTDSVRAGLELVDSDEHVRLVAIHDAARPLVRPSDLAAVFSAASQSDAAILATPVSGTVKRDLASGHASQTVDRRDLWIAQTPQVFRVGLLKEAYAKHNGRPATDDAQLVERMGHDVALVRGSADNLKITFPEDLLIATAILAQQSNHA
ncbi:MAG: 2-C-methyl-D-erythritol 4-phosphate cytidylyltransferase [Rubripirellula sp.]